MSRKEVLYFLEGEQSLLMGQLIHAIMDNNCSILTSDFFRNPSFGFENTQSDDLDRQLSRIIVRKSM